MSNSPVFRKVALDRLASPEQLDQLMRVTDGRGWIALAALGLIVGTGVVWGTVGTIPQNVTGTGILVKSGGLFEVTPIAGGRVTDISVSVGDMVTEGQVVARLAQPDLANKLQEGKAVLAALEDQHAQLVEHGGKDVSLQSAYLSRQRATVEQSIASAEQTLKWHGEKIAIQEKLVQEGLLTKQTLLTTRQQHDAAKQRISEGMSQLAQIAVKELELRIRQQEEVRQSRTKLDQQERGIAELEREIKARGAIVAPQTGRILEVLIEQGAVVAPGEPILTLDLAGRTVKDLEAVIYVPSVFGKQVRVGMPALIAPSTVRQEEYGMMLAKVTYVSDFPATPRGMRRILKNEKLVASLSGGDAPYEIHADLVVDPGTASRYRWSSSQGPPLRIQSGTLAAGNVTVASRRPIEMVIPLFRRYTGL